MDQLTVNVAERLRRKIRNLIPKGSQVRVLPLTIPTFVGVEAIFSHHLLDGEHHTRFFRMPGTTLSHQSSKRDFNGHSYRVASTFPSKGGRSVRNITQISA